MRIRAIVLAAALTVAPLGVQAADLVVWWEEGFYAQEDAAVRETIAAFEQKTGKQVELAFQPQVELTGAVTAALEVGKPPDFAFGTLITDYFGKWAFDDRLVDLTNTVGHFSDLFGPAQLERATLLNATTGQKALYGLPMGQYGNYIHVWTSLLQQAGFTLDDIPTEWDAFWSFWCDDVQPAVRRATGRDDIWGVGLPMSFVATADTYAQFFQFVAAYEADIVTPGGEIVIDDPQVRQRLVQAIDSYVNIYRKGCTPPGTVSWGNIDNNKQFLAQAVVMTSNTTLSIVNALKHERPHDYQENTATIEWPLGPGGQAFPIRGGFFPAVVFKAGGNVAVAKEFVRFLVAEGWLAHYLDFSGERMLPPMPKLLDAPFWLDPRDRHRMAAVMQAASRPLHHDYAEASGNWRYVLVWQELVWEKAVHRVAAEGISPEQAVDEAILRIKQILSE